MSADRNGGGKPAARAGAKTEAKTKTLASAKAQGGRGAGGGSRGRATARETALYVLTEVETEGAYSNLLLNGAIQRAGLSGPDVGLATELVYGTISRLSTIDYFLEKFVSKGLGKLQPWVRNLLRLSFYQIYYLDRIPPHAAVNEAVNIAKKRGHQGISGMVNGVLRNVLRQKETLKLPEDMPEVQRIALAESHPEWMVAGWIRQYGAATAEAICRADNEPPPVSVRVNRTKAGRDDLLKDMAGQGLEAVPSSLSEDGIIVRGGGNMALSGWYREGRLSVQDESSMLVAEALDARPGMTVLDCCAAPGGKSCHIAERMEGRGTVIANDVHAHKAKLIEEQADRLGLANVKTRTGDALELAGQFPPASFDRILLDAPCSGLGVIRRKPDLKWTKSPVDLVEIAQLQQRLLDAVCVLLKPGGVLVYSTCTIERTENAGAVEAFLARHPEFAPDETPELFQRLAAASARESAGLQILPQDAGSDGFYIARLVKQA
ncbi:16S rRNA (cytosine(967)-C(5))-methyltransferase RsmB [Paenibacillus pinistramenti]|uniref:16S rRNA (cytosine(967)-C(5))-methyltransferase RsmB n=1 Tax=Paenibacillus pinistramenti TaxID=1768003 RepID=UPI001109015E|nr:16S rRNA (cytosine(967)-C(5))-methyltransferase RsmB [Paenibacillus pinistramenti]